MATVEVKRRTGEVAGTIELDDAIFGIEPNVSVLHQVVTAQLAARRMGSQSTKTRAEVQGGGAKPWRQKGTGRARQGSTRAPHWRHGGIVFGPHPRDYRLGIPKKVRQLAKKSALNARAREEALFVVDSLEYEKPKTKTLAELLGCGIAVLPVAPLLGPHGQASGESIRNRAAHERLDIRLIEAAVGDLTTGR